MITNENLLTSDFDSLTNYESFSNVCNKLTNVNNRDLETIVFFFTIHCKTNLGQLVDSCVILFSN